MGEAKIRGIKGHRPLEQINIDYSMTCGQLGDFTYRRGMLAKEIEKLNKRLEELDLEASAAKEQELSKGPEKEEPATPSESAQAGETVGFA